MVMHAPHPRTWEAEAEGSGVEGHPCLAVSENQKQQKEKTDRKFVLPTSSPPPREVTANDLYVLNWICELENNVSLFQNKLKSSSDTGLKAVQIKLMEMHMDGFGGRPVRWWSWNPSQLWKREFLTLCHLYFSWTFSKFGQVGGCVSEESKVRLVGDRSRECFWSEHDSPTGFWVSKWRCICPQCQCSGNKLLRVLIFHLGGIKSHRDGWFFWITSELVFVWGGVVCFM